MQEKDFSALAPGDSIQHLVTKAIFIVTGNYGDHVTACATADATNPSEWKLVSKHDVQADNVRLREYAALLEKVNDLLAERAHVALLTELLAEVKNAKPTA